MSSNDNSSPTSIADGTDDSMEKGDSGSLAASDDQDKKSHNHKDGSHDVAAVVHKDSHHQHRHHDSDNHQSRRTSNIRQTLRNAWTASPELEALQKAEFAAKPWPWNMFNGFETDSAKLITCLGCCSSAIVLAVRLYCDHEPTAYLIHSIIVFFDMILIHMFTHSLWLSVTGEIVTYVFFLSFYFTKETMWELLETTLLAILSSFYMISSRKQVMMERDGLNDDIHSLRERGALLLRNIHQVHEALREHERQNPGSVRESVFAQVHQEQTSLKQLGQNGCLIASTVKQDKEKEEEDGATDIESNAEDAEDTELTRRLLKDGECTCSKRTFHNRLDKWLAPFQSNGNKKACTKCYWDTFFEYFLDGAAGVMYTSFLGLIVDAALSYGEKKY